MAYPVIRLDNMTGNVVPSELRSVIVYATDSGAIQSTTVAAPNGSIVQDAGLLQKTVDGVTANQPVDREIHQVSAPVSANAPLSSYFIVATPELLYDERLRNLDDFTNPAGSVARAYCLHEHDVFSISTDGLSGTATVGYSVEPVVDSLKLKAVASPTASTCQLGTIIALETVGSKTFAVIEVAYTAGVTEG